MASPKKSAGKRSAKKPAKKAAKKTATKKTASKKSGAKKSGAKKSGAKKSTKKAASKSTAKKGQPTMKGAAAKAKSAAEDVSVIVQSKVKQLLRDHDLRVDGELVDEVNRRVKQMLNSAADRAKGNNRKTVRPHDL